MRDAEVIARAAAAIDGPVVVVAHSYGGVPTTQAFRQAGNVARIIYLAAFQLLAGESLISADGGSLMSWSRRRRQKGIGDYVDVISPMTVFYNDVEAVTARSAVAQLGFQSYASMTQPLTDDGMADDPEHLRHLRSRQCDPSRGSGVDGGPRR